jgi:hypothetical protein
MQPMEGFISFSFWASDASGQVADILERVEEETSEGYSVPLPFL